MSQLARHFFETVWVNVCTNGELKRKNNGTSDVNLKFSGDASVLCPSLWLRRQQLDDGVRSAFFFSSRSASVGVAKVVSIQLDIYKSPCDKLDLYT